MHVIELPEDYALVLRQINETGEEDFEELAESMAFEPARLWHIIQSLRNKGLLKVRQSAQDSWISVSSKGRRLVMALWPKARMRRLH